MINDRVRTATYAGFILANPALFRGATVLDVGCGNSNWAIDVAKQFPQANVIGIDLGQPQPNRTPSDYTYHVGNFEEDWSFEPDRFDMIHSRFFGVAMKDHHKYIQ